MRVTHFGFTNQSAYAPSPAVIRCGKNLPEMQYTEDWTTVTCKGCLRIYVRAKEREAQR